MQLQSVTVFIKIYRRDHFEINEIVSAINISATSFIVIHNIRRRKNHLYSQPNKKYVPTPFQIFVCIALFGFAAAQRFPLNVAPVPVALLRQTNDIQEDGHYQWAYETDSGIEAHESGLGGQRAEGGARWIAPDGTPVAFTYTADENGKYF